MDTKINKGLLSSWGQELYKYNEEGITNLEGLKRLVNTISNSYESVSSDALITNITSDIDNGIKCHTEMESLQAFLEKVIENAEKA